MPVHFDTCDRTSEDFEKVIVFTLDRIRLQVFVYFLLPFYCIKKFSLQSPKYQNSYRLDTKNPFKIDPVDKIVRSVMVNRLEDASYDPEECPKLCSQVASEIRKRILKLDFTRCYFLFTNGLNFSHKQNFILKAKSNVFRYKIVVAVTIIEKASQSLETSMGFMWDAGRDNYSTYSFETQTFFAYCAVIGTYYE